jgi:hypothetical protein
MRRGKFSLGFVHPEALLALAAVWRQAQIERASSAVAISRPDSREMRASFSTCLTGRHATSSAVNIDVRSYCEVPIATVTWSGLGMISASMCRVSYASHFAFIVFILRGERNRSAHFWCFGSFTFSRGTS